MCTQILTSHTNTEICYKYRNVQIQKCATNTEIQTHNENGHQKVSNPAICPKNRTFYKMEAFELPSLIAHLMSPVMNTYYSVAFHTASQLF